MLRTVFMELALKYSGDEKKVDALWLEVEKAYTGPKRHYHNTGHLQHLLEELQAVRPLIRQWDTVLFSLFYHDFVYRATGTDNEAESAKAAAIRLQSIGIPQHMTEACSAQILATKKHEVHPDGDTNLFTDADLAILGSDGATYRAYAAKIRREYSVYPDFLYRPGRKKVLQHFLGGASIFKTEPFRAKYEESARRNLEAELQELS